MSPSGVYAKNTTVPIDRSKAEIEKILLRYGATSFLSAWVTGKAMIGFEILGRRYRIVLPIPLESEFNLTETGRQRTSKQAVADAWEQATRQRWRALTLWIKAVLEAHEAGIITIQESLTNFTVLPNGKTVGEWLHPQIEESYRTGEMPPFLPELPPSNSPVETIYLPPQK